jgi:chaperonin GroES
MECQPDPEQPEKNPQRRRNPVVATKRTKRTKAPKIVPLGDRIVVKQVKQDETRASGLVIPDTAREKPQLGEVIAAGPGRLDDKGKRIPMEVKVGDRVLYAKYSGQDVPRGISLSEDEEYMVLKESDVLAKLG